MHVFARDPAQHQQTCLLDVKGNPLVRMKETNYYFPPDGCDERLLGIEQAADEEAI